MNNFSVVYNLKTKQSNNELFNFKPSKRAMSTEIEYSVSFMRRDAVPPLSFTASQSSSITSDASHPQKDTEKTD
jgi:hypothetical protein